MIVAQHFLDFDHSLRADDDAFRIVASQSANVSSLQNRQRQEDASTVAMSGLEAFNVPDLAKPFDTLPHLDVRKGRGGP